MRLDHLRVKAFGLLAVTLAAGCGSTVQVAATVPGVSSGTAPADGLGAPAPAGPSLGGPAPIRGVAGPATGPVGSGPAGGPRGAAAGTAAGSSGSGGPVAAAPAARTSGFGFTATQIFIGVAYDSTLSQELGGAGVASASVGDQKQQVAAIVADLNARGGIAGRRVVPVLYDTKGSTSQNDPSTLAQSACSYWTQDHQVFAAMTYVVQMDNAALYGCLAKKHVVFVPLGGESAATFARYSPYLWSPAGTTPEAVAPTWAERLKALGWFDGWDTALGQAAAGRPPVIGLLYGNGMRNNQPQLDQSFVAAVKGALQQQGYQVVDSEQISNNQADLAAAVLRFQNSKVTHVIGDYSVVNFTQAAESQHYRPRYALSSFSGGVAMKLFAPPGQLHGALGIGWVPAGDVEAPQDPGTPAQAHCRSVMERSGQSTSVRLAWFAMTWACDTFAFLDAAIPASGLAPEHLPQAAAGLGGLSGSFTFAMRFTGGRPYGSAVARDYAYDDACSCFRYLSTKDLPL